MNYFDQLLKKAGVKSFDELTEDERQTYREFEKQASKKSLSITDVHDHIKQMLRVINAEITNVANDSKLDAQLKARLKNYLLLDDFLSGPAKAKQALNRYIES